MKHTIFKITLLSALLFTACKKNKTEHSEEKPANQSYQPMTAGSSWTYKNTSAFSGEMELSTFVMQTETKKVADKTYHVLRSREGEEAYFNQEGSLYITLQEDLQGDGLLPLEYLNDNVPAGTTWIQASGTLYQLKTTILEKDLTKVLHGKSYNQVIHTKVELQAKSEAGFETELTMEFYCAKGIGMIQTQVSTALGEISRSELINADIK